eukprot:781-Eustigmatos_ZCMA.PRE.1
MDVDAQGGERPHEALSLLPGLTCLRYLHRSTAASSFMMTSRSSSCSPHHGQLHVHYSSTLQRTGSDRSS